MPTKKVTPLTVLDTVIVPNRLWADRLSAARTAYAELTAASRELIDAEASYRNLKNVKGLATNGLERVHYARARHEAALNVVEQETC